MTATSGRTPRVGVHGTQGLGELRDGEITSLTSDCHTAHWHRASSWFGDTCPFPTSQCRLQSPDGGGSGRPRQGWPLLRPLGFCPPPWTRLSLLLPFLPVPGGAPSGPSAAGLQGDSDALRVRLCPRLQSSWVCIPGGNGCAPTPGLHLSHLLDSSKHRLTPPRPHGGEASHRRTCLQEKGECQRPAAPGWVSPRVRGVEPVGLELRAAHWLGSEPVPHPGPSP